MQVAQSSINASLTSTQDPLTHTDNPTDKMVQFLHCSVPKSPKQINLISSLFSVIVRPKKAWYICLTVCCDSILRVSDQNGVSLLYVMLDMLNMQPKMFSSCDALLYHWNPTSMAKRVGLPPCNGSPTLNTLPHRFSVPHISPVSKSCGDGGVAKRQVEMWLTDHPTFDRFTQSASSALEEDRRHQAQSA